MYFETFLEENIYKVKIGIKSYIIRFHPMKSHNL
jgi:hypothetical protein